MAGSMVYRLRVGNPDADHLNIYRQAINRIQQRLDNKSFNWIGGLHGAPNWYCWHHQRNRRTRLQARLFLPWHRAYLYELEQLLQDNVEGAAIPWWDWAGDQDIPPAFSMSQVDGDVNPLRRYRFQVPRTRMNAAMNRYTHRRPAQIPGLSLPTSSQVENLLEITDYASFNDELENLHDSVHGWVGGDMSDPTTAAFDPIFYSHHCMIDRLWYLWQKRHGNGDFPAEFLDITLAPFGRRVAEVIEVQTLGYEYAGTATDIPTGG